MKIFKKILSAIIATTMVTTMLASCSSNQASSSKNDVSSEGTTSQVVSSEQKSSAEPTKSNVKINVGGLKGPTGIALAQLMDKSDKKETNGEYTYTLVSSPDEMVTKIVNGEVDIASVPTNLASSLFVKTEGNVQLLALNTMGTMSLVTKGEEIKSIADLKGKTIYSSGQGSVVEYTFNYILEKNGLNPETDVKIEYLSEHSELATKVMSEENIIAIVPEPFTTTIMVKDEKAKLALNLTTEWDKVADKSAMLSMGCIIVNKEFATKNKKAVNAFLDEYKTSLEYVNNSSKECADLVAKYEILPSAAIALKAIPNCNMKYVEGVEMKEKIVPFYDILLEANPKSIGGKLPTDEFYYTR